MAQRGFNQTAKIGKHLERRLREVRTADLTEQEGLSREHVRRKAACADAGAFETEAQRERFGVCEDDVPYASSEAALRKAQAAQGRTAAQKAAFPRLLAGALRRTKATAPQSALSCLLYTSKNAMTTKENSRVRTASSSMSALIASARRVCRQIRQGRLRCSSAIRSRMRWRAERLPVSYTHLEPAYSPENTVAVHIRRIREKIEIDPKNPRYLKVVWGIGYKMEKMGV